MNGHEFSESPSADPRMGRGRCALRFPADQNHPINIFLETYRGDVVNRFGTNFSNQ